MPYISGLESESLTQVIGNKSIAGGGHFSSLCENFMIKKYEFHQCYMTPSCTAALEMAALILALNPDDEIIIPSFTFASCPNPFLINGAKVVLADCDENHPNITVNQLKPLLTKNTKAVMLMHYGGCGIEVQEMVDFCKENELILIEDAAQCIHSFYKNRPLGSFGDLSVFSFHETKNVNCGEGGMLVINNPDLVERADIVRQYGTNRTAFQEGKADHYEWKGNGLALFLSELNSAFLYAQLTYIEQVTEQRKNYWNLYHKGLFNFSSNDTFTVPIKELFEGSNCHTFYLKIANGKAENFIHFMRNKGVQVTRHFYPLHLTKFPNHTSKKAYPIATALQKDLVRLPLHHELKEDDIRLICDLTNAFFTAE